MKLNIFGGKFYSIHLDVEILRLAKNYVPEINHDYITFQGRIQEFQNRGWGGPGAVEFLDLRFALMPLHTYPMFLLEE